MMYLVGSLGVRLTRRAMGPPKTGMGMGTTAYTTYDAAIPWGVPARHALPADARLLQHRFAPREPPAVLLRPHRVVRIDAELARRMQRPVRVVERVASHGDQVGAARLQGFLGLGAAEDQSDRHRLQTGFLADPFGKGQLESRHARQERLRRRRRGAEDSAGGAVDDVD